MSVLFLVKYPIWEAALQKAAKPYTTNCLPLVLTSNGACPLWATALILTTILVGTGCISAFLTMECVPLVPQPNGTEEKMLRQKLVFYCDNWGSLCQKLHNDTRKSVSEIAWYRRMTENSPGTVKCRDCTVCRRRTDCMPTQYLVPFAGMENSCFNRQHWDEAVVDIYRHILKASMNLLTDRVSQ